MRKTDLIEYVFKTGTCSTKAGAERVVNAVLDGITQGLVNDGVVSILNFGALRVRLRGQIRCRNPRTGQLVVVPPSNTVSFRPGKHLKQDVSAALPFEGTQRPQMVHDAGTT